MADEKGRSARGKGMGREWGKGEDAMARGIEGEEETEDVG